MTTPAPTRFVITYDTQNGPTYYLTRAGRFADPLHIDAAEKFDRYKDAEKRFEKLDAATKKRARIVPITS
jgi:hypothetical protein